MRRSSGSTCLLIAPLLAAFAACDGSPAPLPTTSAATPIVNGSKDTADPAVVLVALPGGFCTGTLVSKKVVLTARHCVLEEADGTTPLQQGSHRIGFGSGWDGPPTMVATSGFVFYPGTNADLTTDLALIFLSQDAPAGIKPMPVNTTGVALSTGADLRLVGYGITNTGANDNGVKRTGSTSITQVDPTLVFHKSLPSSTCSGDSGGPAFVTIGNDEFVAGVTSYHDGANCDSSNHASVRPDAFLDWLGMYFDTSFDKTPPTVKITSPGDGASVASGFKVTAEASDDHVVARVVLNVDGNTVDFDQFPPYELDAPPNLSTGSHLIEVFAFDGFENSGKASATVNLAPACTQDSDCADGKTCVSGVCEGALGSACSSSTDCASAQCFHTSTTEAICTQNCASDDECPSGFSCEASGVSPVTKCMPGGSGGCSLAATGRGGRAPLALVLGLAFAGAATLHARRRRSPRLPA